MGGEKLKKIIRKAAFIITFVMIFCIFYGGFNAVSADDYKNMGTRVISNVNKIWTLKFNIPVNINSLKNNVKIQDITSGETSNLSAFSGNDEYSAKVNPPSGGYKLNHNYKLILGNGISSKVGDKLPKSAALSFEVTSNGKYTASASVVTSQSFPNIKKIIVSSNLPSVSKYKVEGNNNIFDIGKTAVSIVPQNTVQILLYSDKGNLLGTSTLDTSYTKNNISMNVILQN